MVRKQSTYIKAVVFAAVAFILMSLFWKSLGSFVDMQSSYLMWSWNLVRKITTWGLTIFTFFGGLNERN